MNAQTEVRSEIEKPTKWQVTENRGRTAIIINRGSTPVYRMTEPFTINCAMLYYRRIIRFDPFPGKIL